MYYDKQYIDMKDVAETLNKWICIGVKTDLILNFNYKGDNRAVRNRLLLGDTFYYEGRKYTLTNVWDVLKFFGDEIWRMEGERNFIYLGGIGNILDALRSSGYEVRLKGIR